jgi:hypothetical protein
VCWIANNQAAIVFTGADLVEVKFGIVGSPKTAILEGETTALV